MTIGHNAVGHLRRIVDRVESIEAELAALNQEKSAVYRQAKDTGLVVRSVKKVVSERRAIRKEKPEDRAAAAKLFDVYFSSLEKDEASALPPVAGAGEGESGLAAEAPPDPAAEEESAPEESEPEPEPVPVPHGPIVTKSTFGSSELDGADDLTPDQEPEDNGRQTKPTVNMEFPDGAVPDEFGEMYE